MDTPPLFLQLWSLRHETAAAPAETLRRVRSLGYDGVELAGDYGWTADQWRALLDETGLSVVAAHMRLEALEPRLDATVAFHRALGVNRFVIPSLPQEQQTPEGYRAAAQRLDAVGRRLAGVGFSVAYHNHDLEFRSLEGFGGTCGMDILLGETDPALVRFEFDTFWLEYAGRDATKFVREHEARVCLIHAKDLRKSDRADVPAGQGDVDFRGLLPLCTANGWPVIVEYEGENAVEAVTQASAFLRPLLGW